MSFGKLYSYAGNPRTTSLLAVAKENGLDVEFVETEPAKGVPAEYLKLNKLGKVPTFEGADGFVLSESVAIAVYLASQNEKTSLLGKTKQDYATILRWMSFVNTEVLSPLGGWFRPILGRDPYNKKNVDDSQKAALKAVNVLEEHLATRTYLVGERLTLADLFATSILARGFQYFFDAKWREENPNVSRWYETIYNQSSYSAVAPKYELIKEAIKNAAPQKPKEDKPKKEQAKAAPKPKKEEAEEEEEAAPAPKAKHPLEALPRATFVLDDWKRKYSNEETREVAIPWFWENANFEEYSIYKVDYKYNDELTQTFMTSNLIGGFFARLEGSRKYIFGAASVYGTANDSIIKGAFFIRGQDALPAFDVAPDYESYEFTKLDPQKPEDREFVNDQWSWDKPIEVEGKSYEWADGKGSGGGPSEDNVTGFLVRSTATKWSKNSVLAVDAGSHLAAITRILERDFPLVSEPHVKEVSKPQNGDGVVNGRDVKSPSPHTPYVSLSDEESGTDSAISEVEVPLAITTLKEGVFAGLPFPHTSARANALHLVREHVSTYLITHPHLDHVSGFVINTAAFHNTSRPKRLAALPFTVNAIKTHIFNNIIWPNLTDEDGGVGLVSFQRLAEGGNIALGQGSGRGYIEVCDGLGVKGFKVTHGHCMRGHAHAGSMSDTTSIPHNLGLDMREGRSTSFSLAAQSTPGTPALESRQAIPDQCAIDSTAYFIRTESTITTPTKEVLIFGDVEPDSLSLTPRTALIWAEAAPKLAAGILTGIFIECSYTNAQADAVLFGHLSPRHLLVELQNLADKVREARREHDETRKGRKRKRASQGLHIEADKRTRSKAIDTPLEGTHAHVFPFPYTDDELMTDYSRDATGASTPCLSVLPPPAATALGVSGITLEPGKIQAEPIKAQGEPSRALLAAAFEPPLKGLKIVVIHIKDTCSDGPLVGEQILKELREGEEKLAEQGRALGCVFEISGSGDSYWF
ncbi:hypothetical protein P153DRAFT_301715 [Dothidotthia symphoricarpi CBS 119687]|uniref:EF1G-domain-containing protein n=1 Tax=Dothidotthia symphoricarpi CBS 119687 TaxID=1392245 RepID=A0A6A6A264_9PLEO|nr:uncharacterized protein P153DRAFT_301715 [Dothidotthia symphoricarpi CBS 119687]KAF2124828.1 hypothetical protein P153DRAFT_301715 [Dothidotthia symphoricarpi CBS 119687]